MGQTFVYNMGEAPPPPANELHIEFGVFFDGTLNNRKNTEIRKKVEGKGEFKDIKATSDERKIYNKYAEDDNSFANDFTNVARKSYCCVEKYVIYIEGISTVDKKDDVGEGYKYGRGKTGIIGKVQNGCKSIAEKINKLTENNDKINKIYLTIDAFGFSRGAAAARNFLYNLQMNAYKPERYYPPVQGAQSVETDHDGYGIKGNWVKEGLLPRFGHLGTAMLEAGIRRDMIDKMILTVRFLGVYDTVASYDPTCLLLPSFKKHVGKLHLHDLGTPEKAVHFTAIDEHRENFSLTRFLPVKLKTGIEKNFPGVHSDVGGSYNHDVLPSTEILALANKNKEIKPDPTEGVAEREYIHLDAAYFSHNLDAFRDELVEQGWYKDAQLSVEAHWRYVLAGTRYLYRGYSFIPLHFMSEYANPLLNRNQIFLQYAKLLYDYRLQDVFLEEVKAYLKKHTINGGKNWDLKGNFRKEKEPLVENKEIPQQNNNEKIYDGGVLSGVTVVAYKSDNLLRKLRNKYLHRSAKINTTADMFANPANSDRKRREH